MATTKRQRKTLNAIMVALAVLVVVAGVVFFMTVRGGQEASSSFVVSSKIGYANIERKGINYALDEGTSLQTGDVVETLDGSEIGLKGTGDTELYLADASKIQVNATDNGSSKASLELVSGCVFADSRSADDPLALESGDLAWTSPDAVFVSDVRTNAVTVQVLAGEVSFEDGAVVKAGESRTVIAGQSQDNTSKLTLSSMNSFALAHALDTATAGRELVFSKDQINGEIERRKNERLQQAEQAAVGGQGQVQNTSGEQGDASNKNEGSEGAVAYDGNAGAPMQDSATEGNAGADQGSGGTPAGDNGGSAADEPSGTPAEEPAVDATYTCTLQIRCDTILDNMDSLAEGKSKYVPRDGIILATSYMQFTEGESVFDVLKRACDETGIALEYSYVPIYGSYYVEGIGNLYEFDCGDLSGWMFKVNGYFPNYGCSEYVLSDGDAVVFCYTCQGVGEDVGA